MNPTKNFRAHCSLQNRDPATLSVELLEDRQMLSTVQITAAGSENTESMQLEIAGEIVQTWNNIGGDAFGGQFQTFTFNLSLIHI